MKKLQFMALATIVAATLVGCGNSTPKADLKSDIDSLSYFAGVAATQGLKDYLVMGLRVDTAYMGQVFKGINDGVNGVENKRLAAYCAGLQIGERLKEGMIPHITMQYLADDTTLTISQRNYMAGFIAAAKGKKGVIDPSIAAQIVSEKGNQIHTQIADRVFGHNREAGKKFLAENAKKESVVTLPSGVQYKILREGHGAIPADTSIVQVNYEGRLLNDTIFDSSYRRNTPAQFPVKTVIPGWKEVLQLMPVGSEWEVYIPQEQAYGTRKQPKIEPFSTLIFKVELLDIVDKK